MTRSTKTSIVGLFLLSFGLAGCCGGGSTTVQPVTTTTTVGQELQDLKQAHDKGVLTDKQYEDAKQKLLKQRTEN